MVGDGTNKKSKRKRKKKKIAVGGIVCHRASMDVQIPILLPLLDRAHGGLSFPRPHNSRTFRFPRSFISSSCFLSIIKSSLWWLCFRFFLLFRCSQMCVQNCPSVGCCRDRKVCLGVPGGERLYETTMFATGFEFILLLILLSSSSL